MKAISKETKLALFHERNPRKQIHDCCARIRGWMESVNITANSKRFLLFARMSKVVCVYGPRGLCLRKSITCFGSREIVAMSRGTSSLI